MILLNDHKIKPTIFPDNTSQVWKLPERAFNTVFNKITWSFEDESEFMHLAQLKLLVPHASLHLPYLPYGRQDKEVSNDSTFALRAFCHLLHTLNFTEITCDDPHSNVAATLIKGFHPVYPLSQISEAKDACNADLLCYPDSGAKEKYSKLMPGEKFIFCTKARDANTGEIKGLNLDGLHDGKLILIVDDICDGGATFTRVATLLYAAGAKEVNLFVSHGLFTKGIKILRDAGIKRIFTKEGEQK